MIRIRLDDVGATVEFDSVEEAVYFVTTLREMRQPELLEKELGDTSAPVSDPSATASGR